MTDFFLYPLLFLKTFFLDIWWLWLAFFLYKPAKYLYIYGIRKVKFYNPLKSVLLEIKLPEEIEKTPKAMENVLNIIWAVYYPPTNMREFWIKGTWLDRVTFEIVGKKGEIRFYVRVPYNPRNFRDVVEGAIYGEYPGVELEEVGDYVHKFGKSMPNEEYTLWGCDIGLLKPDSYPIRTYNYWETELTREAKKIDPLAGMFEVLSSLKDGEEIWVQIMADAVTDAEHHYLEESKELINKLMRRPPEKKEGLLSPLRLSKIPSDVWGVIAEGNPIPPAEEEEEKDFAFDLGVMKLSPGETETLKAIQENLSKPVYDANIRLIYIAKKEIFAIERGVVGPLGGFNQFSTIDLNGFKPDITMTKVMPWFFEARRLYAKKRKMFRLYTERGDVLHRPMYIMSTAELATIFHFPGKVVAPSTVIPRVEVRKGGPPSTLPTQ